MPDKKYDVVIIGGGHNGLVAATYLARAGKSVRVLEANSEIGGASQSVRAFPEYDAHLSRYSYLIALLPDKIVADLGLSFECLSREVSSYTPYGENKGLYVSRTWDAKTEQSFNEIDPSGKEGQAWRSFYAEVAQFAERIAPTLLEPLKTRSQLRKQIELDSIWQYLVEEPIGKVITERFDNDVVQGVVLTDALIGTFASAFDLQANICFLYHLIGNGTGEWKVPKGGMGALVNELVRVATESGVEISLNSKATQVLSSDTGVEVSIESGEVVMGQHLLSNAAPQVLAKLRGTSAPKSLDGSQLKINILLKRLPQLKSGMDPRLAFAGTFHANESFTQFEAVFKAAQAGVMPEKMPIEMYCHTLTDPSILGQELQDAGYQTLTLFGLHTPAALFDRDNDAARDRAIKSALSSLNDYLAEPIEDLIAAIEVKTPLDIEEAIALPRGNIFHKDLSMPFREDGTQQSWGVETDDPRIFICGAGAVRGGGVSGIPGHNAAMAILSNN
ncbi:MAG: FAD-dependent oxidoreductase [Actinobacteria bacterium BACL15 MAG-120619-bin91]|jgi:phytoene dehydrogenase-like protein|uniref:Pyridine nucleotide-disulfide oxidoreductase domain-containing protein 2 n=2 Tax=ac1 cluster TaxID=1655545 RepID=A0A0R2PKS2_9ACTN|nr:MAG: FAD-dependent oxidoreductase [Actinobacteria bacterium BACL15 MAG-120619-bin91]KRO38609.1 MAG: FAD-dependent oxidoreductase [Actinobacteria bacterium BACL15 MAG-120823-bin78]